MTPYWVRVLGHTTPGVCVEAKDAKEAERIAATETMKPVLSPADRLPYPAMPQVGPTSGVPPFCQQPERCVGHHACPRTRSCND